MAPSWDHFRSFLAVLQAGSLSGAARLLQLTQPTLGRHIGELEQELGIILFTRTPSGLDPTEAGAELRPYAEAMAGAADALFRAASGEAAEDRGTVRITASQVIATEVLPSVLAAFREQHPRIALEIVATNRNEDLLRRDADIAMRMVRPSQVALVQRHLGPVAVGLHAHRNYLDRHGTPSSLAELEGHALIGFDRETPLIQSMQRFGIPLEREQFALRTDSDIVQLQAIRAGFGIGVCQIGLARRHPDLVRVLPHAFRYEFDCWLAMHEDLRSVRRMRLVFDYLVEGLTRYIRAAGDASEGSSGASALGQG